MALFDPQFEEEQRRRDEQRRLKCGALKKNLDELRSRLERRRAEFEPTVARLEEIRPEKLGDITPEQRNNFYDEYSNLARIAGGLKLEIENLEQRIRELENDWYISGC